MAVHNTSDETPMKVTRMRAGSNNEYRIKKPMPHIIVKRSDRCVYFLFVRVNRFHEGNSMEERSKLKHLIHSKIIKTNTFSVESFSDLVIDNGHHAHLDEIANILQMKFTPLVVTQTIEGGVVVSNRIRSFQENVARCRVMLLGVGGNILVVAVIINLIFISFNVEFVINSLLAKLSMKKRRRSVYMK